MADYRYPRLVRTAQTKLRMQLALACAGLAIALMFIAVKFQTETYMVASAREYRSRHYTRMWFDPQGSLVGATGRDGSLTVERWSGGTWQVQLKGAPTGSQSLWTTTPDLSRVAWLDGSTLFIQALAGSKNAAPFPVSLPAKRDTLAIGALPDASIAVAFTDGSVERWDAATGSPLAGWNSGTPGIDQAVFEGEYLAVAAASGGRALLYRFREEKGWQLSEEAPLPDSPYRVIIPAPGMLAAVTSAGVRIGRETRNSPGAVQAAVARISDLIVAGDFDHVHVLPSRRGHYQVAEAKPGSILAATDTQLAIGGQNGVSLQQLASEERLTPLGHGISYGSAGLLVLAAILAAFGFVCDMLQKRLRLWPKGSAAGSGLQNSLPHAPPDLVALCVSGSGVIWTGAGLSAQAGYPVRSAVLKMLIQMAATDGRLDRPHQLKLASMANRGAAELAFNELSATADRVQLLADFRAIYSRYVMPSRCHELLAQLPFTAAVTTNYDNLLDRSGEDWAKNPVGLDSQRGPKGAELPFLLKLYGNLADNRQALLSHAEFEARAKAGAFAASFRGVFETRRVLFIGCSLEGILADLHALGLDGLTAQRHFAVAGVSGAAWKKQVADLKERFGVEALVCTAEGIPTALPDFLGGLVKKVKEQQNARPHVVESTAAAGTGERR